MGSIRCMLVVAAVCLSAPLPGRAEELVEVWRGEGFSQPFSVSVNACDSSCWVADTSNGQVVHLRADGTELWRGGVAAQPTCVSVSPEDRSCWVADRGYLQVLHLGEDGSLLWSGEHRSDPLSLAADASDGSCWVGLIYATDIGAIVTAVVHLGADGSELWRGGPATSPVSISVDTGDGSCWLADSHDDQVILLSETGTELWRGGSFGTPAYVSANPSDGSCWVADLVGDQVVHLSKDGSEIWRGGGFTAPMAVSVDPTDNTCWVADATRVVHLGADGVVLSEADGFAAPRSLSVDPTDHSVWVADTGNNRVVRLVPVSFADVVAGFWAYDEIMACLAASIVKGYDDGLYRPELSVTRDQMAVYIARALVSPSGDAAIPDPEPPPSFSDVPPTHWAYRQIEYAFRQGVVQGYDDGLYHPEYEVTRDQMAVYVARSICDPTGEEGLAGYVPADPRSFSDVDSGFWAYKHIEYCVEHGVVQGYDDGYYYPENPVTRDQMAVFIARAFEFTPWEGDRTLRKYAR